MGKFGAFLFLVILAFIGYKILQSPFYSSIFISYVSPQLGIVKEEVSKSKLLSPIVLPYVLKETAVNDNLFTKALDPRLSASQLGKSITLYLKSKVDSPPFPLYLFEDVDVNIFLEGEVKNFKSLNKKILSSLLEFEDGSLVVFGEGCPYPSACTINLDAVYLGKISKLDVSVPGGTVSITKEDILLGNYSIISGTIRVRITDANFKYLGELVYRF